MDEDEDLHLCLVCHQTVMGLINYVNHKKLECPGRKNTDSPIKTSKETVVTSNNQMFNEGETTSHSFLEVTMPSLNVVTSSQSYIPIMSSPNSQFPTSLMFPTQMESSGPFATNSSLSQQYTNHLMSMGTSPSHGLPYSTQISFSEDMGPIMSLHPNPDKSSSSISGIMTERNGPYLSPEIAHSRLSSSAIDKTGLQASNSDLYSRNNLNSSVSGPVTQTAVSVDVRDGYLSIQGFNATNSIIDPKMVGNSERSDFFSSLALQKKSEKDTENKDSLTSDLPISNILNNLDLYDDDIDFAFSDDDFLQEAFTDSDDDDVPPPNYTHGKWKPGEGPQRSKVLWQPGRRPAYPSVGKWRPGEMPGKAKGKLKSHILAREQEKAKEKENRMKETKKKEDISCNYCDRTFTTRSQYTSHLQLKEHKQNVSNYRKIKTEKQNTDKKEESNYQCGYCDKSFANRYQYSSHFLSKEHKKNVEIYKGPANDKCLPPTWPDENEKDDIHDEALAEEDNSSDDTVMAENDNDGEDNKELSEEEAKEVEPQKPVHICTICDKKFSSKYTMAKHLLSRNHKYQSGSADSIKVLEQYHKYIVWLSPYQCTICQYYFNKHEDFINHVKGESHQISCESLDGEIMCGVCKYSCHDNATLLKHLENNSIHKQAQKKGCKPCIIREKNYESKCKFCKKTMHSRLHMKRHMRAQHFKEYEQYELTCKVCDREFLDMYTYKRHMGTSLHKFRADQKRKPQDVEEECEVKEVRKRGRKPKLKNTSDSPKKLSKVSPKNPNKSYKCDYCDFVADQYCELRPHYMESHANHIFVCELCDLTFITDKARKVHLSGFKHQANLKKSKGLSDSIKCTHCDKMFEDDKMKMFHIEVYHLHPNSEEALEAKLGHEDITKVQYRDFLAQTRSSDEIRTQCPECPKKIMKDYMLEHLRMHSGDKPFRCRLCGNGFTASLSLRRHLMSHVGLADRKCETCGKEFKKYGSFKEHMLKHRREENNASKLICEICGAEYVLEKSLRAHMKRHGEKRYKCDYPNCNWSFYMPTELKAHIRKHTGERKFLCDICGYAAGTKNRLNRHHRTHTGERAFHCEYCSYKAGTRTHLRRHMRIHIGSKPYQCPYCSYACNTHENIRKHIMKTKKHAGLPIYPCKFCSYGTNSTVEFRFHIEKFHDKEYNFKASDGLAVLTGLYKKANDPDKPMEGTEIIQLKERKVRTYKLGKDGKSEPCDTDDDIKEIEDDRDYIKFTNIEIEYHSDSNDDTEIEDDEIEAKRRKQILYMESLDYRTDVNKVEYEPTNEDYQAAAQLVELNINSNMANAWHKMTPIGHSVHTYQPPKGLSGRDSMPNATVENINYSGQMSSVDYIMPVSVSSNCVTLESGMIPQPPALQVDVVSNNVKWQK